LPVKTGINASVFIFGDFCFVGLSSGDGVTTGDNGT